MTGWKTGGLRWLAARLQVHTRPPVARTLVAAAAARFLPRYSDGTADPRVAELRERGVVQLGTLLDGPTIDRLTQALMEARCFDPWNRSRGEFPAHSPPPGCHTAHHRLADVFQHEELVALANRPEVLRIVAGYLGCKPTLVNVSVWWSHPVEGPPEEAQHFHRDRDDWRFCKLFVYLTDVDAGSGPHTFVEGSHRQSRMVELRRYSDDEVAATFPGQIRSYEGPRGTAFLEDTHGVHKGLPPSRTRRLLFQAEYSMFPIQHYHYDPLPLPESHTKALDPYVNRLLIRSER